MNIEELKIELQRTKKQRKRRLILEEAKSSIRDEDKERYYKLVEKANQPMSIIKKIIIIGLIIYLPCVLLTFTVGFNCLRNDCDYNLIVLLILFIASIWTVIAWIVIPVLSIILAIIKRTPNYYLNIKEI